LEHRGDYAAYRGRHLTRFQVIDECTRTTTVTGSLTTSQHRRETAAAAAVWTRPRARYITHTHTITHVDRFVVYLARDQWRS